MSHYTDLGYTVNSVFIVTTYRVPFNIGELIKLDYDDDTEIPAYSNERGEKSYRYTPPKDIAPKDNSEKYSIKYFGEQLSTGAIIEYGTDEYDLLFNTKVRSHAELHRLYLYFKEKRDEYDRIATSIFELISRSTELDNEISVMINKHKLK